VITHTKIRTIDGVIPAMCVTGRLPTAAELRKIAGSRQGLVIRDVGKRLRLDSIDSAIPSLRGLAVRSVHGVSGLEQLEFAERLEYLELPRNSQGAGDPTPPPRIVEYTGPLDGALASVSLSDSLKYVTVLGSAEHLRFASPVQRYSHVGSPTDASLPVFCQPLQLRSLLRSRVDHLNLEELEEALELEALRIESGRSVAGLVALGAMRNLRELIFLECGAPDAWLSLPLTLTGVHIWQSTPPYPHRSWIEARRSEGWQIDEPPLVPIQRPLFPVSNGTDGEFDVVESDFSWLAGVTTDEVDGLEVERILYAALFQSPTTLNEPEFDSEPGRFAAYFRSRREAERFAASARALAQSDNLQATLRDLGVI
jgi:hypothetical protein